MAVWLSLEDLKNDQALDTQAMTRDDVALQRALDAAMSWVMAHRPDLDYTGAHTVPAHVRLGALRLAARWSPHGNVDLGELGTAREHRLDRDIYELLGIQP